MNHNASTATAASQPNDGGPKLSILIPPKVNTDARDWINELRSEGKSSEEIHAAMIAQAKPAGPIVAEWRKEQAAKKASREGKPATKKDALSIVENESRTDLGNARRLVAAHGEKLRYCQASLLHRHGNTMFCPRVGWSIDSQGMQQQPYASSCLRRSATR